MTVRWTCEQGHHWETDSGVGALPLCPSCGTPAQPPTHSLAALAGLLPSLLTGMGDGLVVVDTTGKFLFFNDAARRMLGRGPDDVPADRWPAHFGIFDADTLEPIAADNLPLVRALRGLDTNQVEFFYRNERIHDGVYASVTGRPLRDEQGVLRGAFIVLRDITRQKRNEQELRRTNMYLAALMSTLPDAIYFKDREHRYLDINQSLAEQYGLTHPNEAIGRTAADFFGEPYPSEIIADEARVMAGEAVVEKQSRQVWADGRERWVASTRLPLRDELGRVVGTIGLTRDVSSWRATLEALRASEALFHNLFDASPDAIFVESFEGVVLAANPAACQLQGMTRDELIGKNILELTPPSRHEAVERGFQAMVRGDIKRVEGYTWTSADNPIPVELMASHIDYGGQRALLLHVRDVSERVEAREDLARSEERFEAAVLGSRDGIWDWDVIRNEVYYSPRWKAMLGYQDREIESRYDEWLNRLHPEDRDRAIQTLQAYLHGTLAEYELEHRLLTRDGTYRWILARGVAFRDRHGNAYRMAGSHTDIHQRKEAEEALRAARVAAEAANRAKGTFLAMVSHELRTPLGGIAVKLVELMAGRIELESTPGQGSVFRFELPVAVEPHPRTSPELLRGRTVLVIEPNGLHRRFAGEFLEELGIRPVLCATLAEARATGSNVDACVVNAEALLDDREFLAGWPRVVQMIQPGGLPLDLPAGVATTTLTLPLLLEDLAERLERLLLGTAAPANVRPTTSPTTPGRSLRILVAEDTLVNQRLIRNLLEKQGHRVEVVDNGRAAVEMVRRETFDAVLMDVSMPEMDGLQATAMIRVEQAGAERRLPIIALTAHALPSDREACLQSGMDGYVSKPIDPRQLLRILCEYTATDRGASELRNSNNDRPAIAVLEDVETTR